MDLHVRSGHVSRARLLGEGSAIARQLARAQIEQQQQQKKQQQQQPALPDDQCESQENEELQQLTWNELLDARTTTGHVGAALREQAARLQQLQLWWPQRSARSKKGHAHGQQAGLLKYSSRMARHMQQQHHKQAAAAAITSSTAAAGGVATIDAQHMVNELFGPQPKRQRLTRIAVDQLNEQDLGTAAAGGTWVCCSRDMPDHPQPVQARRPFACGAVNEGNQLRCVKCGGARWDGPAGQLRHRLRAALQTADLHHTSINQVVARITAEAGSGAILGLPMPAVAVHHELQAFLATHTANKAGYTAQQQPHVAEFDTGTVMGQPADLFAGTSAATGLAVCGIDIDDLLLLQQYGCLAETHGVYIAVLQWLQDHLQRGQQQQQVQEEQAKQSGQQDYMQKSAGKSRLHAAAAAAAAIAPALVVPVFKEQNGQQQVKLRPAAMHTWIGQLFDQATSAAAVQTRNTAITITSGSSDHWQPSPLARPLPSWTLQQLLDGRGALLGQKLADYACGMSGNLPEVIRRYELEGSELMREEVPAVEWLWEKWSSDIIADRVVSAGEDAGDQLYAAGACETGRQSENDIVVTQYTECGDWEAVLAVRQHVMHMLGSWYACYHPSQHASRKLSMEQRLLDRLSAQQQCIKQSWGTAAPFCLRSAVSEACKQRKEQECRLKQPAQSAAVQDKTQPAQSSALRGPCAAAAARRRNKPSAEAATKGAAYGDRAQQAASAGQRPGRTSREVQLQVAQQNSSSADHQGRRPAHTSSRCGDGSGSSTGTASRSHSKSNSRSTSTSSSSSSSSSSDFTVASSESEWVDSEQEALRRHDRSRQCQPGSKQLSNTSAQDSVGPQAPAATIALTAFDAWLQHMDDLLEPEQSIAAPAIPGPHSAWQAMPGCSNKQENVPAGPDVSSMMASLPAGVQVVLKQAIGMGISQHVLQRTAARLAKLVIPA